MIISLHSIFMKSASIALTCEWEHAVFGGFYLPGSLHFVYCLPIASMLLQMMRSETLLWLSCKAWLIEIWLLQSVTLELGQSVLCLVAHVLVGLYRVVLICLSLEAVLGLLLLNLWLERKFCHWRPSLSQMNDWTGSQLVYPQSLNLYFPSPVTSTPVFYRTIKFYS